MHPTRSLVFAALALAAVPALAETRIEKDLKLDSGGHFSIDTDMGKVTVVGSTDSGAHIVVTSRHKDLNELLSLRFDESAGSASVVARKKHRFELFSGMRDSVEWQIRLPAQTRISIETRSATSTATPRAAASRSRTSRVASRRRPRGEASRGGRSTARSTRRAPA